MSGLRRSNAPAGGRGGEASSRNGKRDCAFRIDRTSKSFAEAKRGQICAVIITLSTLIGGVYAAVTGHEVSGSIIGSAGVGGIVTTFILGRAKHKQEEKKVSEPEQKPLSRPKRKK